MKSFFLTLINLTLSSALSPTAAPTYSPATGLKNNFYTWRGQQIRYQVTGPEDAEQSALLVHGLFVNSDHWRKTLKGLEEMNIRAYAIDLLGNGYSSKPGRNSKEANDLNGENGRFDDNDRPSILKDIKLGTANGGNRIADVDLRHPLGSCYNFYTWAELCQDFVKDIALKDKSEETKCSLICNSIGTMTSLQAAIDSPNIFDGVFVVNPNFRELHSAEVPFPSLSMPVIRTVQKQLREKGHPLFNTLATPSTVKQILMEPYAVTEAVDDELVEVLLDPLLTDGAADVVFDTLSNDLL